MTTKTVTREEWLAERLALLQREKDFNRARDALSAARRALPQVRVDKDYRFAGETGAVTLADLFDGHGQLIVYHFMFGPDWTAGCKSCSYWIDNFQGIAAHLAARDTALALVSKGPLAKLLQFRNRMGWTLPWVSAADTDFNEDYGVTLADGKASYNYREAAGITGEMPGISVFSKDGDGAIYHSYSTYARGLDMLNGAYHLLDLTPNGRGEDGSDFTMAWLRLHDDYAA